MSMITGSIKGLLQFKIKSRHDSFTDQFNRIFMVKMAMVSTMLLGLNWFKDTITCIVPGVHGIDKGFVNEACWIQGKRRIVLFNLFYIKLVFVIYVIISFNVFQRYSMLLFILRCKD